MSESKQKIHATKIDNTQDLAGSTQGGVQQNIQSSQLSDAGAQIQQNSGSSGVSKDESHKKSEADHSRLLDDGLLEQPDSETP